jgi:hypothetical protein
MDDLQQAGADAPCEDAHVARRRRGLGPATRRPHEALAQLRRAVAHPGYRKAGAPAQSVLGVLITGSESSSYTGCDQNGMCFPSIGTVAEIVGRSEKSVRESYDQLEQLELISFPTGRSGGRTPSTVRVDAAVNPLETDGVSNPFETDRVQPSTLPISTKQPSRNRYPNQKQENKKAAAARDLAEPEAFTALVAGIDLQGRGRRAVLDAWRDDPEPVAASVAKTRSRTNLRNSGGFLIHLVTSAETAEAPGRANLRAAVLAWAHNVGVHLEAHGIDGDLLTWAKRGADDDTLAEAKRIATGPIADAA